MRLRDQISEARLSALQRMQNERARQQLPTTMPDNFFPRRELAVAHQVVSGLIGRVTPLVMGEAGIDSFEYSLRREFRRIPYLRQISHIISLGHPSSWELARCPDAYEIRLLHEIDVGTRSSVVRLTEGSEFASDVFTEQNLREYIIARLSDPRIVLPG